MNGHVIARWQHDFGRCLISLIASSYKNERTLTFNSRITRLSVVPLGLSVDAPTVVFDATAVPLTHTPSHHHLTQEAIAYTQSINQSLLRQKAARAETQ